MELTVIILAAIIGIEHVGMMYLEMFAKPTLQAKSFDMDLEFVQQPAAQVALKNQGIYNGALGVMLLVSLIVFVGDVKFGIIELIMMFIAVVGCYGGVTATKKIFYVQMAPALITLALSMLI